MFVPRILKGNNLMKKKIPARVIALLLAILMSFSLILSGCDSGHFINTDKTGNTDTSAAEQESVYSKIDILIALIKNFSYYKLDDEQIYSSLIHGFTGIAGDRYAEYYSAENFEKLTAENSGDSQGIGITVIFDADTGYIQVLTVLPGSPAEKAGLMPDDRITHIGIGENAVSTAELGYTEAVNRLQGKAGTEAEFTVKRGESEERIEFKVLREHFESQSVMYHVCNTDNKVKVGLVKLTQFDLTTPGQFCEAMDALIDAGCNEFIFDVRYNGGGDLASITAVLSYMLNSNDVLIKTKDREGNETVTKVAAVNYSSTSPYSACNVKEEDIAKYRTYVEGKSAVLVNGNTASAAELFTIGLKDYGISVIVGTKTYGKGSMQSIIPLVNYGSSGALKLTTKMYFPPISDGYDGKGITPDVTVELDETLTNKNIYKITDEEDNQLQAAITSIGN